MARNHTNGTAFGQHLRTLRRRARLTQAELGIAVGYSDAQISRIEGGLRTPDQPTIVALFLPALGLQPNAADALRLVELVAQTIDHGPQTADRRPQTTDNTVLHSTLTPSAVCGLPSPNTTPPSTVSSLSSPPSPLIARTAELALLHGLLTDPAMRLVTVLGPPGVGKTHLARHAAHTYSAHVFIDATSATDADALAGLIARVLDAPEGTTPLAAVRTALRTRQLLLVLDNLEQVAAAGGLVRALLDAAPELKVLATSRTPLRLTLEHTLPLGPLPVPDLLNLPRPDALATVGAVALLLARLRAAAPETTLTAQNAATLAALAARTEGVPLAIELIAARGHVHGPAALLANIEQQLAQPSPRRTDAPAHHRSIHAALQTSLAVLPPDARTLFARLSIFPASFLAEDAVVVCDLDNQGPAIMLAALDALFDHSLLQREVANDTVRLRMLAVVRQAASVLLAAASLDVPPVTDHRPSTIDHQTANVLSATSSLDGPSVLDHGRPTTDHSTTMADHGPRTADHSTTVADHGPRTTDHGAHTDGQAAPTDDYHAYRIITSSVVGGPSSVAGGPSSAASAATALHHRLLAHYTALAEQADSAFLTGVDSDAWSARLAADGATLQAALAWAQAHNDPRGFALAVALGRFWYFRGYLREGRRWIESFLELDPPALHIPRAYDALGLLLWRMGDYAGATERYQAALAGYQHAEDETGIGRVLLRLGLVAETQGQSQQAQAWYQQSLAVHQAAGNTQLSAHVLHNLGNLANQQNDATTARAYYARCLDAYRTLDDQSGISLIQVGLGAIERDAGNLAAAHAAFAESLAIAQRLSDDWLGATVTVNLGDLATDAGDYVAGRTHYAAALAVFERLGDQQGIANNHGRVAALELRTGALIAARAAYRQELLLSSAIDFLPGVIDAWEGLAGCCVATQPALAARLIGAASAHRASNGYPIPTADQPLLDAIVRSGARAGPLWERGLQSGARLSPGRATALALTV